jgi:hypothetical protein
VSTCLWMNTKILPTCQTQPEKITFFFLPFFCLGARYTVVDEPFQLCQSLFDLGHSPRTVDEFPPRRIKLYKPMKSQNLQHCERLIPAGTKRSRTGVTPSFPFLTAFQGHNDPKRACLVVRSDQKLEYNYGCIQCPLKITHVCILL